MCGTSLPARPFDLKLGMLLPYFGKQVCCFAVEQCFYRRSRDTKTIYLILQNLNLILQRNYRRAVLLNLSMQFEILCNQSVVFFLRAHLYAMFAENCFLRCFHRLPLKDMPGLYWMTFPECEKHVSVYANHQM